jgi:hypothetical protein
MAEQRQAIEPMAALVGTLAATTEAARYASGGVGTVGRRVGRAGSTAGRRAWEGARESGHRAGLALQVLRGAELAYRRQRTRDVVAGFIAGTACAFVLAALARSVVNRADEGRWRTPGPARRAATRPADEPAGSDATGQPEDGVTTIADPSTTRSHTTPMP